ncbi:MAG: LLM class F420-dependent oxidoreductase [Acidimicrobiales bacterium]
MDLGVVYFCTDQTISPTRLATEVEQRGFESLFMTDHSHIPTSRVTPYPEVYGGGELPEFYKRTLELFVTLAAMAAVTERIRLGAGVALVGQRDALYTAKAIASLDHISNGRVIAGVGFGWNQDEAEHHGVDWGHRFTTVKQKVLAMKALWQQEVASADGDFVQFSDSWAWPKPIQSPHPPIYVGGAGPTTMRHTIEWGDTWYVVPSAADVTLEKAIPRLRRMAEEHGRDPDTVGVAVASGPPDPAVLAKYEEQGVERVALWLDPADEASTLRGLDELAKLL